MHDTKSLGEIEDDDLRNKYFLERFMQERILNFRFRFSKKREFIEERFGTIIGDSPLVPNFKPKMLVGCNCIFNLYI